MIFFTYNYMFRTSPIIISFISYVTYKSLHFPFINLSSYLTDSIRWSSSINLFLPAQGDSDNMTMWPKLHHFHDSEHTSHQSYDTNSFSYHFLIETCVYKRETSVLSSHDNKYAYSRNISYLTNSVAQEPEGSSPHSQQPATGPCPEPVESNPHSPSKSQLSLL
jgi:hypothetical protein